MKRDMLSLLAVLMLVASPCLAGKNTRNSPAIPAAPVLYLSVQDLDQLEKLSPEKRTALVQQRRADWDKMSSSKRKRLEASRQKAFDALPMAEQLTLCLRGERLTTGGPEVAADKKTRPADDKISKLDDAQQKQWAEIEKNRRKWAVAD